MNGALQRLIESGELDWDNQQHRDAYLRAWVNRATPAPRTAERPGE